MLKYIMLLVSGIQSWKWLQRPDARIYRIQSPSILTDWCVLKLSSKQHSTFS